MTRRIPFGEAAATLLIVTSLGFSADPPTAKQTMAFTPSAKRRRLRNPSGRPACCQCKVDREERGKSVGWVVLGPEGQILRRFVDSDGDGQVDQWRYFNHGIEVYRDIDSNKNNKPDQCRWLNLGWLAVGHRCRRRRPGRYLEIALGGGGESRSDSSRHHRRRQARCWRF